MPLPPVRWLASDYRSCSSLHNDLGRRGYPAQHELTDRLFLELPQPNNQQQKVKEKQSNEHRHD
jgi:hypothetical protein